MELLTKFNLWESTSQHCHNSKSLPTIWYQENYVEQHDVKHVSPWWKHKHTVLLGATMAGTDYQQGQLGYSVVYH